MPAELETDTVAVVTGATRGVGKGIALALAEAGATVYITGRTKTERQGQPLPGSLAATAREIEERGGRCIGLTCDHTDDDQVRAALARIGDEAGRLDILVNNVFAVPAGNFWKPAFWELPLEHWDTMHAVGLRSHYVASALAAPLMIESKGKLIANVSSFGGKSYQLSVAYGVGKAGVDRLARDMAVDLREHGIASVSLYPGIVRTERILEYQDQLPFDLSESESPELTGRAVAALASDPELMSKTGEVLVVAELAKHYGFRDVDGTSPRSLRERGDSHE